MGILALNERGVIESVKCGCPGLFSATLPDEMHRPKRKHGLARSSRHGTARKAFPTTGGRSPRRLSRAFRTGGQRAPQGRLDVSPSTLPSARLFWRTVVSSTGFVRDITCAQAGPGGPPAEPRGIGTTDASVEPACVAADSGRAKRAGTTCRTLHDGLQQLLFSARMTIDRAVKGELSGRPGRVAPEGARRRQRSDGGGTYTECESLSSRAAALVACRLPCHGWQNGPKSSTELS